MNTVNGVNGRIRRGSTDPYVEQDILLMEVSGAAPETQGWIINPRYKYQMQGIVVCSSGCGSGRYYVVDSSLLCLKMHWQWFGAPLYNVLDPHGLVSF